MIRHQVKSRWYYIFWGVCAVAVVGGQVYVGSGYREMAEATKSDVISVTCSAPYNPLSSKKSSKSGEFE